MFRKPTWQPGILSDEISRGARLSLPNRDHVLFRGGVSELADPAWVLGAPWRDTELEEQGFAPEAESPSLVWPDDRAWVLVTEVDYDSTIVGGTSGSSERCALTRASRRCRSAKGQTSAGTPMRSTIERCRADGGESSRHERGPGGELGSVRPGDHRSRQTPRRETGFVWSRLRRPAGASKLSTNHRTTIARDTSELWLV